MSHQLISRSPDLKRLHDEGYDLEIRSGYLLVKDIPYVNSKKDVKLGTFVCKLVLAADKTARPDDHVAYFIGEHPCHADGAEIAKMKNASNAIKFDEGLTVQHTFSAKPQPGGSYDDYHAKVTTYIGLICGPAEQLDPKATPRTGLVSAPDDDNDDNVFNYIDTASSRAEINVISRKLALAKIAIVGLGGTGAYVLDLAAKTWVKEIHLFDGDIFFQHNAFRSPGAPSIEQLQAKTPKTTYLKNLYSKMRRGVIDHPEFVTADNTELLREMAFVFLCLDRGSAKKIIIERLESFGVPFVDVGMGVNVTEEYLGGIVRVTTSTAEKRDHVQTRVPLSDGEGANDYNLNIQIADLNALNASLAVIKWKKLFGFYRDLKHEHHTTLTIDTNLVLNEERPA